MGNTHWLCVSIYLCSHIVAAQWVVRGVCNGFFLSSDWHHTYYTLEIRTYRTLWASQMSGQIFLLMQISFVDTFVQPAPSNKYEWTRYLGTEIFSLMHSFRLLNIDCLQLTISVQCTVWHLWHKHGKRTVYFRLFMISNQIQNSFPNRTYIPPSTRFNEMHTLTPLYFNLNTKFSLKNRQLTSKH